MASCARADRITDRCACPTLCSTPAGSDARCRCCGRARRCRASPRRGAPVLATDPAPCAISGVLRGDRARTPGARRAGRRVPSGSARLAEPVSAGPAAATGSPRLGISRRDLKRRRLRPGAWRRGAGARGGQQVQRFDADRERDREIQVAAGDVVVQPVGDQGHAHEQQERQREHLDRGWALTKRAVGSAAQA